MLALLSPSKKLDFDNEKTIGERGTPALIDDCKELLSLLRQKSQDEIKGLMDLSDNLAELNYQRYQNFAENIDDAKQKSRAIFAFKGDVYDGFNIESLEAEEIMHSNHKIAILSGLYGLLKPLDAMQPYRLEMGTKLENNRGKDLYDFWGDKITDQINKIEDDLVVNLASNEYFKAVKKSQLQAELLDVDFKENKKGQLKTIGLYAKKARGLMARFIVKNDISEKQAIKEFDYADYYFSTDLSADDKFVFVRDHND